MCQLIITNLAGGWWINTDKLKVLYIFPACVLNALIANMVSRQGKAKKVIQIICFVPSYLTILRQVAMDHNYSCF